MKRRKFITSAFGGVCIVNTPKLPTWIYETKQEKWFENFIQQLNAKKKNLSLDQNLQATFQQSFKHWSAIGYKPIGTNFYVFEEENIALFPVIFDTPLIGIVDISALCFAKTVDGIWKRIAHLTGFHFEAFYLMMQDLDSTITNKQLADALLPTLSSKPRNSINGYATMQGEVNMTILTGEASPKVGICVKVQNKEIWRREYFSKIFRNEVVFS